MRYSKPRSEKEATDILFAEEGMTKILAGGTDILVQMKSGMIKPDLILDIKGIPGIRDITEVNGGYEIGAAVSGSEFNNHSGLKLFAPGIAEAFDLIGSAQIQGRCTIVGNLCNASPAADTVPALLTSNCVAKIVGPSGTRKCAINKILVGPGETSLEKGEFITSIFIPPRDGFSADAYLRFTPRSEMDIAVVAASVFLTLDNSGICTNARVSLGAVAPTAININGVVKLLAGSKLEKDVLSKLSQICSDSCDPIDDKRGTKMFRSHVAGVLAKRAAVVAYKRAGEKSE